MICSTAVSPDKAALLAFKADLDRRHGLVRGRLGQCVRRMAWSELLREWTLRLHRVKSVNLHSKHGVRGDLASLAPLTELQTLALHGTNVYGDVACLIGLVSLSSLWLAGTRVHGDAAALRRAIPGQVRGQHTGAVGLQLCLLRQPSLPKPLLRLRRRRGRLGRHGLPGQL